MRYVKNEITVPLHKKYALTITEAAEYFNIGEKKLRAFAAEHEDLFIQNGVKVLAKRQMLEKYLDNLNVI